jgi:hypothetical protein
MTTGLSREGRLRADQWALRLDARMVLETVTRLRAANAARRQAWLDRADGDDHAAQAGSVYYVGYERAMEDLHARLHEALVLQEAVTCHP